MRLTDLDPRWFSPGQWSRQAPFVAIGLTFECPCCRGTERATRLAVPFSPAIDPSAILPSTTWVYPEKVWQRTGDDFENLTLSPSIDASGEGHWHGFISAGVAA